MQLGEDQRHARQPVVQGGAERGKDFVVARWHHGTKPRTPVPVPLRAAEQLRADAERLVTEAGELLWAAQWSGRYRWLPGGGRYEGLVAAF
ncbi:hypothetical protein [Arthrobacter ulcerisalmonis]|uniref:hypothetical protein n=1 Tax=Arthrobacter ulcerisalmonis TaxID=2483813 RepID=UPI00362E2051